MSFNPFAGQDQPGMPNLDNMSNDPADVSQVADTFCVLGSYLQHKAKAMYYREEGRIDLALKMESRCESLYAGLPQWAKW